MSDLISREEVNNAIKRYFYGLIDKHTFEIDVVDCSANIIKEIDKIPNACTEEDGELELMNYEGCGRCEKCGEEFNCKEHTVPVTIKFNKAQKWDNFGSMVTAFRKDDVVQGEAVIDGNKVYCAGATSTVYTDINDFIALEDVEIVR